MTRNDRQTLLFIHGVGGAAARDRWLAPLSDVMAQRGFSRPERSGVDVITVDYRDVLLDPSDVSIPREVWRRPADQAASYSEFQVRRAEVHRIARAQQQLPPTMHFGSVPQDSAESLARAVEVLLHKLRAEARVYRTNPRARASVLDRVLAQLPTTGRAVIVAHSLGSVVAADMLKRLPTTVLVDQLLTLGSPLSMTKFWPFVTLAGDAFPFDRVRSWVNVFDSRDPVTGGRGIGRWYPEAVDVDVHLGSLAALVENHAAEYYLSLPVVGALVGDALFGPVPGPPSPQAPARQLGKAWDLYLLSAAYALQASATCDARKHRWRRRFDAARRASVLRLMTDIEEHRASLPETAHKIPTESDFLDHAAALVKGTWSDEALLPFAVALLMSSPVRPYETTMAEEHRVLALTSLFDRVRRDGANLADPDFAKAVAAAVREAREAMGGRSSLWAYLMLGGAAVLAATGIGVWAAMPTGIAGAALLTSTLAALGPGGMVGGMITIAAASGAGSALVGAGLATSSRAENEAAANFADSLAKLPKEQLRATATGMIAVAITQDRLSFTQTAEQARTVLTTALAHIVNEENAHRGLGSADAEAWEDKRKIVERAMNWLDDNFPSVTRQAALLAIGKAEGALTIAPALLPQSLEAPRPISQKTDGNA